MKSKALEESTTTVLDQTHHENLTDMSPEQVKALWDEFDVDKSGELTKYELKALARKVNQRLLTQFKDRQRSLHPNIKAKALTKLVQKEAAYLLPPPSKGKKKNSKGGDITSDPAMVGQMVKMLDVDGNGQVSRMEFMMQWKGFAIRMFDAHKAAEAPNKLKCAIM
jgi:Ca2+-binding EF-hand superfamily protein